MGEKYIRNPKHLHHYTSYKTLPFWWNGGKRPGTYIDPVTYIATYIATSIIIVRLASHIILLPKQGLRTLPPQGSKETQQDLGISKQVKHLPRYLEKDQRFS